MTKVEIYTSPICGFCYKAKALLSEKGVDFEDIDILAQPWQKAEMMTRSRGRHTVPQIFINNAHIGGCDDLYGLDSEGKLDPLLTS